MKQIFILKLGMAAQQEEEDQEQTQESEPHSSHSQKPHEHLKLIAMTHTQRTVWIHTALCLLLPTESSSAPCLVDSESLGVLHPLRLLNSFCLLFCGVPWVTRGRMWWRPPVQTLSLPGCGLGVCSHLLQRKPLWWWLDKALTYECNRISLGIIY